VIINEDWKGEERLRLKRSHRETRKCKDTIYRKGKDKRPCLVEAKVIPLDWWCWHRQFEVMRLISRWGAARCAIHGFQSRRVAVELVDCGTSCHKSHTQLGRLANLGAAPVLVDYQNFYHKPHKKVPYLNVNSKDYLEAVA
jgi:hypothetical protein